VPERVVVVGGGVGGLATALALGRNGHEVTLLERDVLPVVGDADEAFAAERRGAPQAHQTHGFLARIVVVLRERFPDVLDALREAGGFTMPGTAKLGEPQPGDEDLSVLIVRRTTFEWVLRRAVLAEPGVEVRTDTVVSGLVADPDGPSVAGVRLDDGTELAAMARFWNLLGTPTDLMGDAELITRMAEVMAEPEAWPAPPREGPKRDVLLEALAAEEPAA
jgi:2-polyprenyl-6-methoxyphenol hydroxylase-like FAD-dependent oxidoreductase